jgi:hypothetical protein
LSFIGNPVTSLILSDHKALRFLLCYGNELSNLDVSGCPVLSFLACSDNPLGTLDISNNLKLGTGSWYFIDHIIESIVLSEMPSPPEGITVDTTGSPNIYFTTECSK